jgi:hypothetical protein
MPPLLEREQRTLWKQEGFRLYEERITIVLYPPREML